MIRVIGAYPNKIRRSPRLAAVVFKPHLRQCHRYFSVHFSPPCKNGHWQKERIGAKEGTLSLRQERPIIHSLRSPLDEAHAVSEKERKKTFAIHRPRPRRRRRLCGARCAMGGGGVCGALGQSEIGVHFPGEEGRERDSGGGGGGEEARAGNHRGVAGSERMGGTAAAGCLVSLLALERAIMGTIITKVRLIDERLCEVCAFKLIVFYTSSNNAI